MCCDAYMYNIHVYIQAHKRYITIHTELNYFILQGSEVPSCMYWSMEADGMFMAKENNAVL